MTNIVKSNVLNGLIIASTVTAASAFAQEAYIGLGYGQYKFEFDNEDIATEFSDSKEVYRVYGGGMFTDFLGVELAYLGFGDSSDNGLDSDIKGLSLAGIIELPVSEYFSPYAKLGWLAWEADITGQIGNLSFKDSLEGDDLLYGVGVAFGLGENVALRIEYERFEIDDNVDPELDIASISGQLIF